jgi:hypothetical protein
VRRFFALSTLILGLSAPAFAEGASENSSGTKDWIALIGILATFLVSVATFIHSLRNDRRVSFVNTVSTSRLKWIDSLRDKVSEFIAVTNCLISGRPPLGDQKAIELLLQRDTLVHQIVLHLNPHDDEDRKIKALVDHVRELTDKGSVSNEISDELIQLRDATADYLKKEWNRVKSESTAGQFK